MFVCILENVLDAQSKPVQSNFFAKINT